MSQLNESEVERKAAKSDYPSVVGGETPAERAIDNAYIAVDEEVDDPDEHRRLANIPSRYIRGTPTNQDARDILNDLARATVDYPEVQKRISDSKAYLRENRDARDFIGI
jgi:hypothetical protein